MKIKNQKTGKMEDVRLPKQFKTKWLKALRSGEFKQGDGSLRNNLNQYCCLGVGAKICGATSITGKGYIEKDREIRGISKIPSLIIGDGEIPSKLAYMNDNGKSFKQIADWIDKNL